VIGQILVLGHLRQVGHHALAQENTVHVVAVHVHLVVQHGRLNEVGEQAHQNLQSRVLLGGVRLGQSSGHCRVQLFGHMDLDSGLLVTVRQ